MNDQAIPFCPADILLPKRGFEQWAVVACDQYTSEPEYWNRVEEIVGDAPSAYRLILPEAFLEDNAERRKQAINQTMRTYLANGIFDEYKHALFYTERTQRDGRVLQGLIGAIDLAAYDYRPGSHTAVRATEGTILDRVPPRAAIRREAALELPHIMLLIDDPQCTVIEPLRERKEHMRALYDFTLMQGGGQAAAYLIDDPDTVTDAMRTLFDTSGAELQFAIGDGNHSLAAAKACYEQQPTTENRYALVQVVNIHSPALDFEPIYRVVYDADYTDLISAAEEFFTHDPQGQEITVLHGEEKQTLTVRALSSLPVGTLGAFLDGYLAAHPGVRIDYVHGIDTVERLAREGAISFVFNGMKKSELFPAVIADGALPRKTFSMGHAHDKRYYIEARKIAE